MHGRQETLKETECHWSMVPCYYLRVTRFEQYGEDDGSAAD